MQRKIIQKTSRLTKERYYEVHLEIVNAFLPIKLTPKELEVLAHFMSLDGDIEEDRFGTSARKIVKTNLGLSDGGLGNHLKSLLKKGFLQTKAGRIEIHPIVMVNREGQMYQFKLENIDG